MIHLKRFKFTKNYRGKIRNFVDFPVSDLSLKDFVTHEQPWNYDLYGVINHSGTLSRGHYTAYCKNRENQKWYRFDDGKVDEIETKQLVSSDAYLLFYHKNDVEVFERQSEIRRSSIVIRSRVKLKNPQMESKKGLKSCILIVNEPNTFQSSAHVLGKKKSHLIINTLTPVAGSDRKSQHLFFTSPDYDESIIIK